MSNPILAKRSEHIFDDKFENLSSKELALEIKHYRVGTAPENPSFLANQEECKKCFIEKFKNFFTHDVGLELPILISNIGDGKTHFIRMISDAYSNIPNIRVRRVYIREEQMDIKFKVLEAIERNEIKECVNEILLTCKKNEEYELIINLQEKYSISRELATTLIRCKSHDLKTQSQAIQLLKGNISDEFIEKEKLNDFYEKSEEFYFDFLRLLCNHLEHENLYIIIVFDEIEHIMDWKDSEKQKRFFRNIKELTDNISIYKNIFLILAATEIYMGSSIINQMKLIEPATYDRMKSLFIRLKEIESDEEVLNLIMHLRKRYEKFYPIHLDDKQILEKLKKSLTITRGASTYRLYAQEIIRIFDECREKGNNKEKEEQDIFDKKNINNEIVERAKQVWYNVSSAIANKSLMVESMVKYMELQGEVVEKANKRTGFIIISNKDSNILYYIIYTSKNYDYEQILYDKIQEALLLKKKFSLQECIILIQDKMIENEVIKQFNSKIKVISYNESDSIKLMLMLDEKIDIQQKKEFAKNIKMAVL